MNDTRKLALITGASTGIGLELARVFAKNDYDIVVVSNSDKINGAASLLRKYDVGVTEIIADLASQKGIDEVYRKLVTMGRPIDVAALNAGVGVGGEFINTDFTAEKNLMNLNMVYLVGLTKKLLHDMVARNEGKILFTSSIAAEMPGPYYSVYAASKAFVQSFAEALRYEMKDTNKNVTITSLQPGPTDTEFFERADMEDTKAGEAKKDDPAKVAEEGFEALMSGKDHIIAGSFKNKIQATAAKFMSEELGASAQGASAKPKSLEQ